MPHAELKYSADLQLDARAILAAIETSILTHDPDSGACKGRAYPTDQFHHSHLLVSISMLTKPHRNKAFSTALISDLEAVLKGYLKQGCFFSLSLTFSDDLYITNEFTPERGVKSR